MREFAANFFGCLAVFLLMIVPVAALGALFGAAFGSAGGEVGAWWGALAGGGFCGTAALSLIGMEAFG